MHLTITRHGETEENKRSICQGHYDSTLSETGIEQAKKLALRLKDQEFDVIFSSDLQRAEKTAREIVRYHLNTPLILDKRLRERFLGSLEGTVIPSGFDWEKLPEGVETREELYDRAKEFLDEVYDKYKDKRVLFVCHGGTKAVLLVIIHNKQPHEMSEFFPIKNTAVSYLELEEDGNHKIRLLNCSEHLHEDHQ